MSWSTWSRASQILAVLPLAAALAGCGGDPGQGPGSGSAGTSAVAGGASGTDPVGATGGTGVAGTGAGGSGQAGAGQGGTGVAGSGAGGSTGGGTGVAGVGGGAGAAGTGHGGVGGSTGSNDGCGSASLPVGDHALALEHAGQTREFDVHVPASYDPNAPTPVVFYFHPLLMNKEYLKTAGGTMKSDAEGFIAVFAQGLESSWNAGACCGPANGAGGKPPVDDVGFVRSMVEEIASNVCVDARRVYATGFSNGGFLSNRLACEAADVFAAIAPVSAVNGMEPTCAPSRPMPVFAINGTTDTLVPYEGGFFFPGITNGTFASVQQTFDGWANRNGCTGGPTETFTNGDTTCQTYSSCNGGVEVTQCTVGGGGHCWFGEPLCALGTNSFDIVATDATWSFLRRFMLP